MTLLENAPWMETRMPVKYLTIMAAEGLPHFFWSNAFAIRSNLFVGLRANYTFGAIERESLVIIQDDEELFNTSTLRNRTSYSKANFQFGVTYIHRLDDKKALNFGATYSFRTVLEGRNEELLLRGNDTLSILPGTDASLTLPQNFGAGVAFTRNAHYTAGVDFEFQPWSNSASSFRDRIKIAAGGEWIPDYDNVNSYFKRVTYRAGFNYETLPYVVGGEKISDFGINFGMALPVSSLSQSGHSLQVWAVESFRKYASNRNVLPIYSGSDNQ